MPQYQQPQTSTSSAVIHSFIYSVVSIHPVQCQYDARKSVTRSKAVDQQQQNSISILQAMSRVLGTMQVSNVSIITGHSS